MTTLSVPNGSAARHAAIRSVCAGLSLAASPVFILMGLLTTFEASSPPLCSSAASMQPVDPMGAMYLLMSLFHLPAWLTLLSGSDRASISSKGEKP